MTFKTRGPAAAGAVNGPGDIIKQLRSPPDTPSAGKPQAPWLADDCAYFAARDVNSRVRFPFPGEFTDWRLEPGRDAIVNIMIVERDGDGRPRRARRRLCFVEGGRA